MKEPHRVSNVIKSCSSLTSLVDDEVSIAKNANLAYTKSTRDLLCILDSSTSQRPPVQRPGSAKVDNDTALGLFGCGSPDELQPQELIRVLVRVVQRDLKSAAFEGCVGD